MIAYHVIIFLPPALTLMLYIVFGSDFFLFAWTDNLSLYFITRGTLDQGFNCHVINSLMILLLFLRWRKLVELEYWLIYTSMAGALEYWGWKHGVNAARRIDPSWNERRGFLYPSRLYDQGWVQDVDLQAESSKEIEDSGSNEDIPDIASVMTL